MRIMIAKMIMTILLLGVNEAKADDADKVIDAMRRIGKSWELAISEQWPIINKCGEHAFSVRRFSSVFHSTVSVDVRRTSSVINPYVGVLEVTAYFDENDRDKTADGNYLDFDKHWYCFKNVEDALDASKTFHLSENSGEFENIIYVEFTMKDKVLEISAGNKAFSDLILHDVLNDERNLRRWEPALRATLGD